MQSQSLALSRTTALPEQERLDFARIGAFSAVIAVHVIAAGLLLAPMRVPDPGRIEQSVPITIVLHEIPPPPLVPPIVKPKLPPTPSAPTKPIPQHPIEPRNSAATSNTTSLTASINPSASTAVVKGDATEPVEPAIEPNVEPKTLRGAQLAYASTPAPVYPRAALLANIEGTVILEVTVDEHGKPVDVVIAVSSGSRDLDRAARDQVLRAWRFQPAMENGRAVRAIGRVPVNFTLNR